MTEYILKSYKWLMMATLAITVFLFGKFIGSFPIYGFSSDAFNDLVSFLLLAAFIYAICAIVVTVKVCSKAGEKENEPVVVLIPIYEKGLKPDKSELEFVQRVDEVTDYSKRLK